MSINWSVPEPHFVLWISRPPLIAQKWFCIQNVRMDLSFQEKSIWKLDTWLLRYWSKKKSGRPVRIFWFLGIQKGNSFMENWQLSFCPALSKNALDQYSKMSVCVSVCLSPISRPLIGRANGFWQWFWHPTYPTRCSELGWAVPRSDFLAWLSSATLKISISGVSSRIWML